MNMRQMQLSSAAMLSRRSAFRPCSRGSLSRSHDEAKVEELEMPRASPAGRKEAENSSLRRCLTPVATREAAAIRKSILRRIFLPVPKALAGATADKKLIDKIADGLSAMDKNAKVQHDKKGNIIYDKETKDTEIVKFEEDIDTYMAREVLPHIPDAAAFFEENLGAKMPVIKTGAEIPFTRYFYKYQQPTPSEAGSPFYRTGASVSERVAKLPNNKGKMNVQIFIWHTDRPSDCPLSVLGVF